MNEFVEQFLIECRELVEQATDDLLTLEGRPEDKDRLDGAFRAFHTLKGAAGIVDFTAMAHALHAAEDLLASTRAGLEPVTPRLISDCLTCLDQVVQWLDAMAVDGEIPAGAEDAAEVLVRRFDRGAGPAPNPAPTGPWLDQLLAQHPGPAARLALRYAPDVEAFLRGEDPLTLLGQLPGLLAVAVLEEGPWPPLDQFDPFACRLVFGALTDCSEAEARRVLAHVAGQVAFVPLARSRGDGGGELSQTAIALLEAQVALLGETDLETFAGRIGAAGRAAANVMHSQGRSDLSERLAAAAHRSLSAGSPAELAAAIEAALGGSPAAGADPATAAMAAPAEASARTLRVDVERIDALVNLTGELLVAKNALGHAAALAQTGTDPAELARLLKDQHAILGVLVNDLQRSVLNIRVLPMRYVFQRFPRLVREMVVALGKPAHLVTEGDDTEADKVIVEGLFEPLVHILRNAMDHGVESAPERAALGKAAPATIRLSAARQGDQVVIEVTDDGGGIDLDRVRKVAAARGVATAEALQGLDEQAVIDLVFAPGFSTAETVTDLSGRGVGMDAVRAAVERLGGRVTLSSRAGEGTSARLTLPFAVVMSRVLTVEAGGQVFGVPLEAVRETVRIDRGRILPVGAARAFVLRNRTIPIIDLAAVLGEGHARHDEGEVNLVVAAVGGRLGSLEVDRLGDRLDVMLKPLEGLLAGMPGIAGTTLLGDGRILIVLDLQELLP